MKVGKLYLPIINFEVFWNFFEMNIAFDTAAFGFFTTLPLLAL